ncbi:ATP/GTP-binding protein [Kineosporia sp. A_224]|uniref:GTP-binding protein n=1 Tax=Kineosporia sp. A_224 TaxID=1962180 RepID=UPI000B4C16A8|nr:ATP/GTP-binding protein [Kineosporia sp. A_224]
MASDSSPETGPVATGPRRTPPVPVKILVAGGFGVGKTTTVATVSEIAPLTTEARMTSAGIGVDDNALVPGKTTTTVAMDFGRITIDDSLKLYIFGTPGQDRFGFMWNDLAKGALGALVLVDDRRLDDCFAAVDYFERMGLPFVVGVNRFDGGHEHDVDTIRWALAINPEVPIVELDARKFLSVRDAILVMLHKALEAAQARAGRPDAAAS